MPPEHSLGPGKVLQAGVVASVMICHEPAFPDLSEEESDAIRPYTHLIQI